MFIKLIALLLTTRNDVYVGVVKVRGCIYLLQIEPYVSTSEMIGQLKKRLEL